MRGGPRYKTRIIEPDPQYHSTLVSKFVNRLMLGGKKEKALRITYDALMLLGEQTKKPALEAFETAIKNVSPLLEVRSRRIGGATYQVPMEVRPDRKIALAMGWVIEAARTRQGKPMEILLAQELSDAYQGVGTAMKKREDKHKMAEANRAFAHYARF